VQQHFRRVEKILESRKPLATCSMPRPLCRTAHPAARTSTRPTGSAAIASQNAAKIELQIAMPSSSNANISRLVPSSELQNLVSVLRNDTLRTYARAATMTSHATFFNIDRYMGIRTCIQQMYEVRLR
jgi:hypothetical protein